MDRILDFLNNRANLQIDRPVGWQIIVDSSKKLDVTFSYQGSSITFSFFWGYWTYYVTVFHKNEEYPVLHGVLNLTEDDKVELYSLFLRLLRA